MRRSTLKILALFAALLIFSIESTIAYSISVDGARGRDGSKERDYSTSPGASSGRGNNGSNATRSTPGQDAGSINITLSDISSPGQASEVRLSGHKITADGRRVQINDTLNFGRGQVLNLSALGGRGGDGGHGGNGQGGCNGRDGRDARKRQSAGNGTDGCNGGNGGDGTAGSNGGNGGQIIVNVSINDVHLLRSININVEAGSGGNRGRNGDAGRGGRGGDGGRGDRWQEKTGTRQVRVSYQERVRGADDCNLVSNGDNSFSNRCTPTYHYETKYRYETEDVYEWFSTPAGRDGSNGRSGNSGNGRISAGNRGSNGNYVFNVIYPNNRKEQYLKPFQLKITSYNVVEDEATRNGIFEPGEIIHLENITVTNSGGAPSPNGNAKVFTSLASSSLQVIKDRLEIPALKRGERHTFRERLTLRIPDDSQVGGSNPVEILHSINPTAHVDKTRMRLSEFGLQKALHAKHPVVLTFFDVPEIMAPGEKLPLIVKIKNISSRPLGDRREIENNITSRGGDTPSEDIHFGRNQTEQERSLTWAIENLGAGEMAILETFITLSDDTPVYTGFSVQTTLLFERLGDDDPSAIQRQILDIKVAQKYNYREDAKILLVTNSNTTRDEYNAWMRFSRDLNIKMDIWDLSYYGSFSLSKSLESGSSLMENYRNKTVLFIKSNSRDTQQALRTLQAKDFLKATQDYNINFLFVGGSEDENQNLINAYLNKTRVSSEEQTAEVNNSIFARLFSTIQGRRAESLQAFNQSLLDNNPNQRFIIEARNNDTLVARPALGISGGHAYTLSFSEREIHSPQFILSKEMRRAVLLPLSFNSKLDLMEAKPTEEVRDAIMFDLIHEVSLADQGLERSDRTRIELMSNFLSLVNKLKANKSSHYDEILAGALEYADYLNTNSLKKKIKDELNQFSSDQVTELRAEIAAKASSRHQLLPGLSERDNLKNMLTLPAVHRVQSTDHIQNENILMENQ